MLTFVNLFLLLVTLSAVNCLELIVVEFAVLVEVVLSEELWNGLLAVLTVEVVDIGELGLADEIIVIGVEIVEDRVRLLWADVTFIDTATVSEDFAEQVFELAKLQGVTVVLVVDVERFNHDTG